jgi:hypothetical protein
MTQAAERLEDRHEDHEGHEGRATAVDRITAPSWSFVILRGLRVKSQRACAYGEFARYAPQASFHLNHQAHQDRQEGL